MRRLAVKIHRGTTRFDANDGHIGLADRRGKPPTRLGRSIPRHLSLDCVYVRSLCFYFRFVVLLLPFSFFYPIRIFTERQRKRERERELVRFIQPVVQNIIPSCVCFLRILKKCRKSKREERGERRSCL